MEDVLSIVRSFTDIPHPLLCLLMVPQCSKKTESLLRDPTVRPSLLEPSSEEVSDHNLTGKLQALELSGLPNHSPCLQCTSMPLVPLGRGRLGPPWAIPFLLTGFCFPTEL